MLSCARCCLGRAGLAPEAAAAASCSVCIQVVPKLSTMTACTGQALARSREPGQGLREPDRGGAGQARVCDTPDSIPRRRDLSWMLVSHPVTGRNGGTSMQDRPDKFETHHLPCMVCGALPGITCVDGDQERPEVHPSRRMSIAERNWRSGNGWEPPGLIERRRTRQAEAVQRAPLFNPRLGPGVVSVLNGQRVNGRPAR